MWKRLRNFRAGLLVLLVAGCVNIPPESITVNAKISAGITVMQENTNLVIDGWRDTAMELLKAESDLIYKQVEVIYLKKGNIPKGQALNTKQIRDVAGMQSLVYLQMSDKINEKVDEMKRVAQANATALRRANNSITGLLESAQAVISRRQALIKDFSTLSPIITNVVDFINNAKKTVLDAL